MVFLYRGSTVLLIGQVKKNSSDKEKEVKQIKDAEALRMIERLRL